jgi:hypothetical protein
MKNLTKTIILILILTIAGSSAIFAQRGDRGMRSMRPDSINRSGDRMMRMQMHRDSVHSGMPGRQMMRMHDNMRLGPMAHMRHGYGMGPRSGWGPGPRFRGDSLRLDRPGRLSAIPNLTDKQKKDIADLRQKHMDEMKKFREENQAKMNTMRESFRNEVKSQLTDEQKKFFDGDKTAAPSVKK